MTMEEIQAVFEGTDQNNVPEELRYRPCICPYNYPECNRHVKQFKSPASDESFNPRMPLNPFRMLSPDTKRLPYRRRTNETISVSVNYEKRDLLMWLEFLVNNRSSVVIFNYCYRLAVVDYLARVFPETKFYVFGTLKESRYHNVQHFTQKLDSSAECAVSGQFALIYCNTERITKAYTVDSAINISLYNMQRYKELVQSLNPQVFLLPFYLPWSDQQIEFFAGKLFIPPHGFHSQTELALVSDDCQKMQMYDAKTIEEQMFYFNTYLRGTLYYHHFTVGPDGRFFQALDCCFDCTSELYILCQYFYRVKHIDPFEEVYDMNDMWAEIDSLCRPKSSVRRTDNKKIK